jgi:hypothetical protein
MATLQDATARIGSQTLHGLFHYTLHSEGISEWSHDKATRTNAHHIVANVTPVKPELPMHPWHKLTTAP